MLNAAVRDVVKIELEVVILLDDETALLQRNLNGNVQVAKDAHSEVFHHVLSAVLLLHAAYSSLRGITFLLFVLLFSVRVFVVLHLVGVDVLLLIVALQILVFQLAEEKDSELVLPLLDEHLVAVQVLTAARLGIKCLSLLLLVLLIGFLEIAQILRGGLHLEGRIALRMYPVELSLN